MVTAAGGRPVAGAARRASRTARRAASALAVSAICLLPSGLASQQPQPTPPSASVRANREELEQMRAERERLEARMRQLQSTAHDISEERTNLARMFEEEFTS